MFKTKALSSFIWRDCSSLNVYKCPTPDSLTQKRDKKKEKTEKKNSPVDEMLPQPILGYERWC